MKELPVSVLPIHSFAKTELNLKGIDLMVFSIVYNVSQDGISWYNGGISFIQQWTNASNPTIIKSIQRLEEKELIIKKKKSEKIDDKYMTIMSLKSNYTPVDVIKTVDSGVGKKEFKRITERKIVTHMSIKERNLLHFMAKCKDNEHRESILLFVEKYFDFMEEYTDIETIYLSSKSVINIIDNLSCIDFCSISEISEEEMEEILDWYVADKDKHIEMGYNPSLSHLTDTNFMSVYIERLIR